MFQTTLAPPLYLTFEGDNYKKLTWYSKEAAAREQVGRLLNADESPAISLTSLEVVLHSFLPFFFFFESWCLKSTFKLSSMQSVKNVKPLLKLKSEKKHIRQKNYQLADWD